MDEIRSFFPMPSNQTDAPTAATRPFLITFSGIDGAGKSTQIELLSSRLQKQGLRVLHLSFWDDIAALSEMRAGAGYRAMGSSDAKQVNEPSLAPRNNKHVKKWYLTAARSAFYVLDVGRLHRVLASQRIKNCDVVIFDRYVYDQIANIYSQSHAGRSYAKLLLALTPAPDLAFVIDASPAAAFARKPEYPLEFVYRNRQTFLSLRELVPQLTVISEGQPEDVSSEIYFHISRSRLAERPLTEGKPDVAAANALVLQQSSCTLQNEPTAGV
jgi:thymidylate kinase